ncbi:MAG: TonB-dependent receptor, partial [Verrucomicrobia bacterium]|nr:TonB-dependent receptor [Verrucomicrobiota bacterium]
DEAIYKKAVLVERGSFRPVTHTTQDILDCAQERFVREAKVTGNEAITLMEITMQNLLSGGQLDHTDFLDRVDVLGKLGRTVIISKFGEYFRLGAYLSRCTDKMVAIAMGIPSLIDLFQEKYYTNLEGGIMESFGRLFKNDLKLYVYPMRDPSTGEIVTASSLKVAPNLQHLHAYLLQNHYIEELEGYKPEYLDIFSRDVLKRIRSGDPSWEKMVPEQVADMIKVGRLYNYQPSAAQ